MNRIIFPLQPGQQGPAVVDLQDALLLLVSRQLIRTFPAPNRPTVEDLRALSERTKIERTQSRFGGATRELLRHFQNQNGLGDHLAGIVEAATAEALNRILTDLGALDASRPYEVSGRVFSERAGVGGLRVQVVDKGAGPDFLLAEGVTDERGQYKLSFSAAKIIERGKSDPDIQIRVLSGDVPLGASEVRYNATPAETLDVILPAASAAALPSEHATLTGAIAAHYKGRLADLEESDSRSDITYLANKTGWDARAVALAALADQFSARTAPQGAAPAIAPPFFYALFRAGVAADENALYRVDAKTLETVWTAAAQQGVISKDLAESIPETVRRFQALSAEKLLTGPALVGVSSLKEVLESAGLSGDEQQRFAVIYAANRADTQAMWDAVGAALGQDAAARLQLNGKLAFLTINNAPLMRRLQEANGEQPLADAVQLAQAGFHRAGRWGELLNADTPIPAEIPGETQEEKRANYADFLAAQVRLSYPTAAVAEMVKSGELPVEAPDHVHRFLTEQQGRFEIAMQPVEQFIARQSIEVAAETVEQIKRLQRVYQVTPNDRAMTALMNQGLDAAYKIARFDKQDFVRRFAADLEGAGQAALVYDRARQVHNATLNIAISYLTAKSGIALGASPLAPGAEESPSGGQLLRPAPAGPAAKAAADVIAYPTLESLFGSMDFCDCEHCRSVLSPAAYLVDLLQFIDRDPAQEEAEAGKRNPQAVLLERRPDIQHLPLTCENTNTALPYIDVVNETLEYFIANDVRKFSLEGYTGYDTGEAASADLMASPQFVMDAAYSILRDERFPPPLPFHQPLEYLRRLFKPFDVPLALAMERLRPTDDVERGDGPYGWRDILMEEVGLSREEYEILTDAEAVPLWRMYGFPEGTAGEEVTAALSNARRLTRRLGISYTDLAALLRTRFINPNSDLIPKLERLGVSFAAMQALRDGTLDDAAFDALLPAGAGAPDPARYDGDIKAWVRKPENFERLMAIITLSDPDGGAEGDEFGRLELRYSKPAAGPGDTSTRLGEAEYVRLMRFIRLWKKTGWTVEQTDAAICALYKDDLTPLEPGDLDNLEKLDAGFSNLLPRLGVVVRALKALNLTAERGLRPLLACWSEIGTHGNQALYRQMFLNAASLNEDAVFADDGHGNFLNDPARKLAPHAEALRGAFNLTAEEFEQLLAALGFDGDTPLTLENVTAIYRRGWLARALRLSVRELLLLTSLTGLDPFAPPDPPDPPILRLVALVRAMRDQSLKPATALYLIWNQDLSGKSAPDPLKVAEFARTLRSDFAGIDDQFEAPEEPASDFARSRIALVYGEQAADAFFELLDNTISLDVSYTHGAPSLEEAITAVAPDLGYDVFRHRLSHKGLFDAARRDALKGVPDVTADFKKAVDDLFARGTDVRESFFTRHPELRTLYEDYNASADPPEQKQPALLAAFRPELARRRKRQQALQRLSDAAGTDAGMTQALLDPENAPYPLHAAGETERPALDDVTALGTHGLAARFFFRDTATGDADLSLSAAADLDYFSAGRNRLPANPDAGAPVSGIWQGQVEIPEPGYYNIVIEADAGAAVELEFAGQARPLAQNGAVWRNAEPLQLKAGTLYDITLKVEKVKDRLAVKWETPKRPREVIPGRYLYAPAVLATFGEVYVRFLKAASLASHLRLTAEELAHFANDPDYRIAGDGWLNTLAVSGDSAPDAARALLRPFEALLDFARIKAELSPDDDRLLSILRDPEAALADGRLAALARWEESSLNDLLSRFGGTVAGLRGFELFRRVYDAFAVIRGLGVSAGAMMRAATNAPDGGVVRQFQAALRARYAAAGWRDTIQPINDEMRGLRRDALVAGILHQMREKPETAHIDTPEKLFEYFLMDVQMEPCMLTSRIRHALSSIQLFVERCLMNLEPRVSPASINARQWAWMKRYRVWEANRKVFLWPENWLEPELRDNKSPFFKELESELLQQDITEESAATAMLNYLAKLEEIARLEPCGMHVEEATETRGEVIHLVARTAGAGRKYYYRRYEHGYWTSLERIELDIEDNPVIPYVWNGRLLLFWLRILKKGPDQASQPSGGKRLTEMTTSDVPAAPGVTVQAVLCWSEYYNGKWQAAKTSDVNRPTEIGSFAPGVFNRSNVRLAVLVQGDALRVYINPRPLTRQAPDFFTWPGSFLFYNTHSLPVRGDDPGTPAPPLAHVKQRDLAAAGGKTFGLAYSDGAGESFERVIIKAPTPFELTQPRHELRDVWNAPFFFADSRHVFFVTSEEERVRIRGHGGFGVFEVATVLRGAEIPPLVVQPAREPKSGNNDGAFDSDFAVVDPAAMRRFVTEDAYIRQGLGTTLPVRYGGRRIGPSGSNGEGRE